MTTMSLRLTAGARDCSTYARNVFPLIEPSITHGAVIPFRRRPATKVRVFQCPCGTQPTSRSPRGQPMDHVFLRDHLPPKSTRLLPSVRRIESQRFHAHRVDARPRAFF